MHVIMLKCFILRLSKESRENIILGSGPVGAGIEPVVAGMCRHEPVVPVRAGPGRLVPEPVPAQVRAGRCLSLPEPLKDRKKRCNEKLTEFNDFFRN